MALGSVKHSKKKVKSAFRRGKRTSSRASGERNIKISVRVGRAANTTNEGRGREGQFHARACLLSKKVGHSNVPSKCGFSSYGRTPTAATKAALRSLAAKLQ